MTPEVLIFKDVVTKERYKATRVTEDIAEVVDARVGEWMIQPVEGGPVKIISAVQSVTEYEEVPF